MFFPGFHQPKAFQLLIKQFENLVLSNRKAVQKILGIDPSEIVNDNPFFQLKANDRRGCQIDYMIQTKFGTCYLCEIKFNAHEITKSVIDEVKQKIKSLALHKNIIYTTCFNTRKWC